MEDKIERMVQAITEPGFAILHDEAAKMLYTKLSTYMGIRVERASIVSKTLDELMDDGKFLGSMLMARFIVENWNKLEEKSDDNKKER